MCSSLIIFIVGFLRFSLDVPAIHLQALCTPRKSACFVFCNELSEDREFK